MHLHIFSFLCLSPSLPPSLRPLIYLSASLLINLNLSYCLLSDSHRHSTTVFLNWPCGRVPPDRCSSWPSPGPVLSSPATQWAHTMVTVKRSRLPHTLQLEDTTEPTKCAVAGSLYENTVPCPHFTTFSSTADLAVLRFCDNHVLIDSIHTHPPTHNHAFSPILNALVLFISLILLNINYDWN